MKHSMCIAAALALGLTALPAMAATPATERGTTSIDTGAGAPSQRNPLLADNGDVRMSKMVGTNVYNDHDKKLGSVDDVLIGSNGQPIVVMKVNGHLTEVPWNKLRFGDAQKTSDNKIIMPNTDENALNSQQQFHYTAKDNG